jgi:hypothetical protein
VAELAMAVTRLSAYAVVPTIVMTDRDLTSGARVKGPWSGGCREQP